MMMMSAVIKVAVMKNDTMGGEAEGRREKS